MPGKPLTINRTIYRALVLATFTALLVVAVQFAMALCVHWAAQVGVTPREPIQVIHYTHSGCEGRPALTQPFGDLSPEEHSLTPDGHDTPTWKAPRTPNTP